MLDDFGESKVTVSKAELLSAIRANRAGHREAFLTAQAGYRDAVISVLDAMLADARNGRPFAAKRIVELIEPTEHTRDYDRVIKMLEMSKADEISISEHQFAMYVQDDWAWKAQFIATNSRYAR